MPNEPTVTRHFSTMRDLAHELGASADRTFVHRWQDPSIAAQLPPQFRPANWDHPGRSGESVAPKYLYRGESSVFPSSMPSRARITATFDARELELLDELSSMASWVWRMRFGDPFRSVGWPQHYGFPTDVLDVTSDPSVALHFAADRGNALSASARVLYRIDLEAIEQKVYGPGGAWTPLAVVTIAHEYCERAKRQSAWILRSREDGPFDFQTSQHLADHVERFTVDAPDGMDFVRPSCSMRAATSSPAGRWRWCAASKRRSRRRCRAGSPSGSSAVSRSSSKLQSASSMTPAVGGRVGSSSRRRRARGSTDDRMLPTQLRWSRS
jgi:hypothetical protein